MRLSLPLVLIATSTLVGCQAYQECNGEEVLQDDGTCKVPEPDTDVEDTDVEDTDVDTQVPVDEFSLINLSWTVAGLPNKNVVTLTCGGRELLREDVFTFYTTLQRDFRIPPNQECVVKITDIQGGLLPGGKVVVCSEEVASWEAQRANSFEAARFNATECIEGCPDPVAENYNADSNLDDGSCQYILGCVDERALNYNPAATKNDGSCDFGGFGPLKVTIFTDEAPEDTTLQIVCDDAVALEMKEGPGVNWATWSAATATTVLEGGFACDVVIQDSRGDRGPSGVVENCGEVVATWGRTEAQSLAYETVVGSFFSDACSGCDDEAATNFDPDALINDGSCIY